MTVLGGLRVLEMGGGMAAPLAGMILADHGADVVKVERGAGDWARDRPGFAMWNRGKRSVHFHPSTFTDLVRGCDVLITALSGSLEVSALPPHAVHCEITGWGPLTRFAHLKAYEGVVAAAIGKMMGLDELSGAAVAHLGAERPLYTAAPVNSYGAAQLAVQGIIGALLAGGGDHVTVSLAEASTVGSMRHAFAAHDRKPTGQTLVRRGIALCFLVAECSDGKWIQMCARQDDHFRNWLRALGLERLLDEPRFAGAPMGFTSFQDIEELEALLRSAMRRRSQAEWIELFTGTYDVGADPFLTREEFLAHPQMVLNERVVSVAGTAQVGPLVLMSETPARIGRPAPALGEHTNQVAWPERPSSATVTPRPPHRPLEGVTVVELATFLAGPLGATLVAELGARVIKVEPPEGDSFRRVGLEAVHLMSGKESVVLDLKTDAGRLALHALLANADVVLQNFRPGVAARLGFDYETVRALNPQAVYVTAGSYGPKGPQSHRAAFHSTPNALCGGGIIQAGEGNPPVDDSYPDPCAGTAVATAIMLGLYARECTGRGQHVETSMLASAGYVHSDAQAIADQGQHGPCPWYRLYECSAGWVFVAAVTDEQRQALRSACARAPGPGGMAPQNEMEDAFLTRTADEWVDILTRDGVGVARADVASFEECLIGEGVLAPAEHPEFGRYWKFRPRIHYRRLHTSVGEPCSLGQHTDAVLREFALQESGVR
jgi:crotonobetainyl-CoA:carnitine CoA-transferase CaiB-like acyl-CoA transferase